jgi:hypothetical protein
MSNSKDNLTQEELILHHHAAVLKQNLEAYHACMARDEETWRKLFRALLVFFYYDRVLRTRSKPHSGKIDELFCQCQ